MEYKAKDVVCRSIGMESTILAEDHDRLFSPATKPTLSRRNSRCQMQRDSDFMVCQICGWRMRITDPSLPPEKYHARCGGAEVRSENERRPVRPLIVKRSRASKQPARKQQSFQLGTFVSRWFKKIGIKQKSGCGCGRREQSLNRWGRRILGEIRIGWTFRNRKR